ncbi:Ig-like domain-containing protein [Geobacter sulfurreducens]|uniref:Ig-like domain-containing protein n=1 Tax=Geobacter sulfurreducens TaxID=35554 RepID=UPI0001D8F287|nr:Ig-like domain-containing protein [Geobacter sulfurreducens]ADI84783.1 repeat-containing protein [Geobacter sulfurreducens KN400]
MKTRTLTTLILAWLLSFTMVAASQARDVTLQWDANTETTVAGYKVYYNADSAGPPFSGTGTVGKVTSTTLTGLDPSKTYYFAVTAYDATGTESTYSNIVSAAEATAPTVSITSPASGSSISGTTSVAISATDNVGVTSVELYVDGVLKGTDTSSPYSVSLNTTQLSAGTHTLQAKAYDAAGNVGQSTAFSVTVVNDTTAPTASITSPTSSSTVSGTVTVNVSATDAMGVSKVELYVNGTLYATYGSAPYSITWNTSSYANGTYTLQAKAYDAAGNVGQSSSVTVTVSNTVADTTVPTVAVSSPANGATVTGTVSMAATASDNVGVSKVEFYVNNVLKGSDTTSPYAYSWDTTSSGQRWSVFLGDGHCKQYGRRYHGSDCCRELPRQWRDRYRYGEAATASDNVGVSKVEFYVNNVLKGSDTTSPYAYSWDTTSAANGSYTLTAKAYDAAGNVGQSSSVTVSVNNVTTPPSGSNTAIFGNAFGANFPNTVEDTFLNINDDVNATGVSLSTYTWPAATPANAVVMKWDVSALPANAEIQSATLYLYLTEGGGDDAYEIPVSAIINKNPVVASSTGNTYDGTNAWTASSVAYGGVPLAQSDIDTPVDAPLVDKTVGYKAWNITNLVKTWLATPAANRGVLLNSSNKAAVDSYRLFASSEASDTNLRPKLVVTYNLPSDTAAPTVAVSAPANGATVSGTVTVSATASDNVGVTKVEFMVNGTVASTVTTAPYSYSWNTTTSANGTYTLTAKAYDAAGNIGQSTSVSVTVNNQIGDTTAPTVSITSPANNATVKGSITVSASASDNVKVTKVEFYLDNVLKRTDTSSPFTYSLNTTSVSDGTHTLTAKAYDAAGNIGETTVTVKVANDATAPTVSLSAPTSGATVSGVVSVNATATDNLAVAKVEFYVNNVLASTDTTSPYSYSWDTSTVANGVYSLTAKAYDAAGNSKVSTAVTVTVNNIVIIKGDVDGDGAITANDALIVLKAVADPTLLTSTVQSMGDVAPVDPVTSKPVGNGKIDINDVLILLRRAVGLTTW